MSDPATIFGKDNLRTFLRARWDEHGEALADGQRMGIEIAELVAHSQVRNAGVPAPFLDLWVAILDELNSWLISLLTAIYAGDRLGPGPANDFERSLILILAKLISDTTALRHLITLGFDGAAKTLLRSLIEYMQLLVAIIHFPYLATEFVETTTPEAANSFFFNRLARGKANKRVYAAWADFFKAETEAAQFFADRQRQDGTILSGTAHPSFAGGEQATLGFLQDNPEENWLGLWGAKSHASIQTISIYAENFLSILLLSDFPFSGFDGNLQRTIDYNPQDEMHRHVKLGRPVLSSLILSTGKPENFPFVYPEGFAPSEGIDG